MATSIIPGSQALVGFPKGDLEVSYAPVMRVIDPGSESSQQTEGDMVEITYVGAATVTDLEVYATAPIQQGSPLLIASEGTEVVGGIWRRIDEPSALETLEVRSGGRRIVLASDTGFGDVTAGAVSKIYSPAPGTLAEAITAGVDSRIGGVFDPNRMSGFLVQDHGAVEYARNPDLWCADVPDLLTCSSPWNSAGGATRAGTLVSPRHILFAAHYQIPVGATLRFVAIDGTVVTRTLTASTAHPDYLPYYPDLVVGLLDADVPAGIGFASVLPADLTSLMPSFMTPQGVRFPAVGLDQFENFTVADWYLERHESVMTYPAENSPRFDYFRSKIVGDSGNPCFLIVGNTPVLLTLWTYGGPGSGTSVRYHQEWINEAMSALGGGYQLTILDVAAYPVFV